MESERENYLFMNNVLILYTSTLTNHSHPLVVLIGSLIPTSNDCSFAKILIHESKCQRSTVCGYIQKSSDTLRTID